MLAISGEMAGAARKMSGAALLKRLGCDFPTQEDTQ